MIIDKPMTGYELMQKFFEAIAKKDAETEVVESTVPNSRDRDTREDV